MRGQGTIQNATYHLPGQKSQHVTNLGHEFQVNFPPETNIWVSCQQAIPQAILRVVRPIFRSLCHLQPTSASRVSNCDKLHFHRLEFNTFHYSFWYTPCQTSNVPAKHCQVASLHYSLHAQQHFPRNNSVCKLPNTKQKRCLCSYSRLTYNGFTTTCQLSQYLLPRDLRDRATVVQQTLQDESCSQGRLFSLDVTVHGHQANPMCCNTSAQYAVITCFISCHLSRKRCHLAPRTTQINPIGTFAVVRPHNLSHLQNDAKRGWSSESKTWLAWSMGGGWRWQIISKNMCLNVLDFGCKLPLFISQVFKSPVQFYVSITSTNIPWVQWPFLPSCKSLPNPS